MARVAGVMYCSCSPRERERASKLDEGLGAHGAQRLAYQPRQLKRDQLMGQSHHLHPSRLTG
jgi:hypothetical protein